MCASNLLLQPTTINPMVCLCVCSFCFLFFNMLIYSIWPVQFPPPEHKEQINLSYFDGWMDGWICSATCYALIFLDRCFD